MVTIRRYQTPLTIFAFVCLLFLYYFWRSELWDFQRLTSRYSQYARGGNYNGTAPHMSPDQSKIIFSTPRTGRGDIYKVNLSDKQLHRLTDSNDYEGEPIYSPDGKKIAYVREDAKAVLHIWVMDSDGNNQRQLTNSPFEDVEPAFTSKSDTVVFTRQGRMSETGIQYFLYSVSLSKGEATRLSPPSIQEDRASFDYKGERHLYSSDGPPPGLWVANKSGKTTFVGEGRLFPNFSPDGEKIVFVINNTDKPRQLCVMNWDGSSLQTVYETHDYISGCSFSSDSKKLIFEQTPIGDKVGNIILFDLATRKSVFEVPVN